MKEMIENLKNKEQLDKRDTDLLFNVIDEMFDVIDVLKIVRFVSNEDAKKILYDDILVKKYIKRSNK